MAKLIGTNPNQVPTNADLGSMAYQDKDNLQAGPITIKDGRVGIGDVTPASELHLTADSPVISFESENNASGIRYNVRGTATQAHRFQYGGSTLLELASNGSFGIGGSNYGTSGQVLTSSGSGSAPTWTTVSAGAPFSGFGS